MSQPIQTPKRKGAKELKALELGSNFRNNLGQLINDCKYLIMECEGVE